MASTEFGQAVRRWRDLLGTQTLTEERDARSRPAVGPPD
jgi:hypothetical protein